MWILVVITVLLSNSDNLALNIKLERKIIFKTQMACTEVEARYNKIARRFNWQGPRPEALCIYDGLSSDDLIKQLDDLDKALEKTFPNIKK